MYLQCLESRLKVLLATFGLQNCTTEGVIKVTSSDISSTVLTDKNRLNAICTNVTFVLKTNSLLDTAQVNATLGRSISATLYDTYANVIEVNIESCSNGNLLLVNGTCVCRLELNSSPIKKTTKKNNT